VALAPGPDVGPADLPREISAPFSANPEAEDGTLRGWSRRYARLVLERCDGNKRRACDVLDITYHTLQSLLDTEGRGTRIAMAPTAESQINAGLCEVG